MWKKPGDLLRKEAIRILMKVGGECSNPHVEKVRIIPESTIRDDKEESFIIMSL